MAKKKFIDKKKSAKFQLVARDWSEQRRDDSSGNDRVFVRVDNNSFSTETFFGSGDNGEDSNSIFDDAPEDFDAGESSSANSHPLPEHVRKEILELGLPDDGYNYLIHVREIKNSGGGSAFYNNPKTKLYQLPSDVKAYDASRLRIPDEQGDDSDKYMYNVASETVGVRVQRAVDPEVAALLEDDDRSRFDSDFEDLEEDFVIKANLANEDECVSDEKGLNLNESIDSEYVIVDDFRFEQPQTVTDLSSEDNDGYHETDAKNDTTVEQARERRALDDQFDLLVSREYANDDCEDDEYGYIPEETEILAEKLMKFHRSSELDDFDLDGKYRTPADLLRADDKPRSSDLIESAKVMLQRCVEYADNFDNNEDEQREERVLFEGSSEESEEWDCDTIVSTYTNLDNHPGKIQVPEPARKKKFSEVVSGALTSSNPKISLKGREKMPVDFLPHGRKPTSEKVKEVNNLKAEQQKRKPHGQESKEEKKERKAAVKEERREARRSKKELKGIYKGEAQHAQRVAAVAGPSSIHLT